MTHIPRPALLLGLAGLLPFLWGGITTVFPDLGLWSAQTLGARFTGPYIGLFYGAIILSFMSGVLWGFATRADGVVSTTGYALSVIPALWAFFTTGGGAESTAISLMAGFVGLLAIDWLFWKQELAPHWWMSLRIMLTVVVVGCLTVPLLG